MSYYPQSSPYLGDFLYLFTAIALTYPSNGSIIDIYQRKGRHDDETSTDALHNQARFTNLG